MGMWKNRSMASTSSSRTRAVAGSAVTTSTSTAKIPSTIATPTDGPAAAATGRENRRISKGWWLGALLTLVAVRVVGMAYPELSGSAWWQDPAHRDLAAIVSLVAAGAGLVLVLALWTRRQGVSDWAGLFHRCGVRWWRREPPVPEATRQQISAEMESRWIDHLVEAFQRDVFYSYVGPGFASPNGKELPEVVSEVRSSGQSGARMSFAYSRARSRHENRLRDLEDSWELSHEALDRLEREVQASYQILLTCHSSIRSWQ